MLDNPYFIQEMKTLLSSSDYDKFVDCLDKPMYKALRINTLKSDHDFISEYISLNEKSAFDENTYLISSEEKLGKHPFHIAGLYYIQEPSATMAVNALDVKGDDFVLDLCAAPGGKSTQILNRLSKEGFLVSNEYDKKRANTLLSNLERWGYDNYLLTNNDAKTICEQLEGVCDKVLVDAPCSGASMFKKYPETVKDYNLNSELACQKRQLEILSEAYKALKQDGILVYSTCTYNLYEDEQVVEKFINEFSDMQLVDTGLSCGQKGYDPQGLTRRCFPFNGGEGHFVAKFIKKGEQAKRKLKTFSFFKDKLVDEFIEQNCYSKLAYTIINNKVYCSNKPLLKLNANCYRSGILLGEIIKNRIEPDHHFFITYTDLKNVCELTDEQLDIYLSGRSLFVDNISKGYVQLRYKNVPIGFGKSDGKQIKNHLPKGLRSL